jgi:hypothetical protein
MTKTIDDYLNDPGLAAYPVDVVHRYTNLIR